MSDKGFVVFMTGLLLAVVLLICFLGIQKALRTGKISYGGNRVQFRTRTYTRTESPLGFWGGILVYAYIALMAILAAAFYLLTAVWHIDL